MIYLGFGIIVLMLIAGVCTGTLSARRKPVTGLINGKLHPCPSSPNCVCSEFAGHTSYIPPITSTFSPEKAWKKAATTIGIIGGRIIREERGYIHATFTSRIFRFVDDLELRMDINSKTIHIRSASRTGYSDFGVNHKRIEQFRTEFMKTAG